MIHFTVQKLTLHLVSHSIIFRLWLWLWEDGEHHQLVGKRDTTVTFWSTMEHAISRTCARLKSPESSSTGSRLKPICMWKETPCEPGTGLGARITGGTLMGNPSNVKRETVATGLVNYNHSVRFVRSLCFLMNAHLHARGAKLPVAPNSWRCHEGKWIKKW